MFITILSSLTRKKTPKKRVFYKKSPIRYRFVTYPLRVFLLYLSILSVTNFKQPYHSSNDRSRNLLALR